jgi:single-strand DNA-binding protein
MHNIKNNVQLIGHLGRNPEIKTLESGKKVAKILLATSEYRKNEKGEKETHTTWHNVTAWGNTADIAEKYLIKGKQIVVQGKISNRMYTDKDGIKRYYSEVIISDLQMIA